MLGAAKVWFEQGNSPIELGIWCSWMFWRFLDYLFVFQCELRDWAMNVIDLYLFKSILSDLDCWICLCVFLFVDFKWSDDIDWILWCI